MIAELIKIALLFALIFAFSPLGPVWACCAVGLSFATHALICMLLVQHHDNISALQICKRALNPMLPCIPMVLAVIATRWLLRDTFFFHSAYGVAVEVVVGVVVFIPAAFFLAPSIARDFLNIFRSAILRRGKIR